MIVIEEGVRYAVKLLLILVGQSSFSWAKQKLRGKKISERGNKLEQQTRKMTWVTNSQQMQL